MHNKKRIGFNDDAEDVTRFENSNVDRKYSQNSENDTLKKIVVISAVVLFGAGLCGLLGYNIISNTGDRIDKSDINDALNILTTEKTIAETIPETELPTENNIVISTSETAAVKKGTDRVEYNSNIVNGGIALYDGENMYISYDKLLKVDTEGNQINLDIGKTYFLNCDSEYIYYELTDNFIYRSNKNGENTECLYSYEAHELTLYDGHLYFCSDMGYDSYHICRMDIDGENIQTLSECNEWYMSIAAGKIYYTDYSSNRELYKMNLDGSERICLSSNPCYDLLVTDEEIFFSCDGETRKLYKMNLNGDNPIEVYSDYAKYSNYYNGRIYFTDESGNIFSIDTDGKELKKEFYGVNAAYINIASGKLVYCDSDNTNIINVVDLAV